MTILKALVPVALCVVTGCDYVNDPLVDPGGSNNGGEGVTRKVLLEDFTGHTCNNCPSATRTALQLQDVYGEDLVIVGIHVTPNFAAPADPPNPDGSYSTDFRTPEGNAYESALGISFLPTGAVSRTRFNNSQLLAASAWGSAIGEIIGEEADLDIWFSQLTYDDANTTVTAEVKIAVMNPIASGHNLTIYLTEDHVTDWQLDNQASPPDVENYDHRHVFRTAVNGTWGVPFATDGAAAGDTITLSYPDFPLNAGWDPLNCSLVAYAYNTASEEILQVADRKFEP